MNEIFSHAAKTASTTGQVAGPGARTATAWVPVQPEFAFDGFTAGIHLWWPMEDCSGYGLDAHAAFEDGRLVEESPDGRQQLWAEVREWVPPSSLVLDWQLSEDPLGPTTVTMTFRADDGGTMVSVVHEGWAGDGRGRERNREGCDWPLILSRYVRFMGGHASLD